MKYIPSALIAILVAFILGLLNAPPMLIGALSMSIYCYLHYIYKHYPKYTHNTTGKTYYRVKDIKVKTNGLWQEAIEYKNKEGEEFVRIKCDFINSFTKKPSNHAIKIY